MVKVNNEQFLKIVQRNILDKNVRNVQKRKYLITYYIIQKSIYLKNPFLCL